MAIAFKKVTLGPLQAFTANAPNSALIRAALKSLPVFSIALPPADIFSTNRGLYVNPEPAAASGARSAPAS